MDSPGNDLESTAGQTASGCNFIAFTTGNGAVTNHPLVPTAKIITTTRRYQLVGADMDFNAGKNAPCYSCIALVLLFREIMFSHSHSLYFSLFLFSVVVSFSLSFSGRLMDGCGEHTVETLGDELYDMIVRQASGLEPTQGETHGHAGTCDLFELV